MENADYVTNWITGLVVSGIMSMLVATVKDKLTFAAIVTSFFTATFLCGVGYPLLVAYDYGGLVGTMVWSITCGAGGVVMLLMFVGVIRKFIERDAKRMAERALGTADTTREVRDA